MSRLHRASTRVCRTHRLAPNGNRGRTEDIASLLPQCVNPDPRSSRSRQEATCGPGRTIRRRSIPAFEIRLRSPPAPLATQADRCGVAMESPFGGFAGSTTRQTPPRTSVPTRATLYSSKADLYASLTKGPKPNPALLLHLLRRVGGEFEHTLFGDIGERFGVARPREYGVQRGLGLLGSHMVLEFFAKAAERRAMIRPGIQHAANVRRQGDVRNQVMREQLLALINVGIDKASPGVGQCDIAFGKVDKSQELQGFADGEQLISFQP